MSIVFVCCKYSHVFPNGKEKKKEIQPSFSLYSQADRIAVAARRPLHLVVASSKDPQQVEEEVDEVEVKLEGA